MRWLACALLLCGCDGTTAEPGLEADMRVAGAQYVRGAMPGESGGPALATVVLVTNEVRPGQQDKPISGALAREASAVALGLRGDAGYWIVPAGAPTAAAPDQLSFRTSLSFSPELADGEHELVGRAVDAAGRFGPARTVTLTTPAAAAADPLRVTLRWDSEADLDLRVIDASGVEIWKRNINSFMEPPPGQPVDPAGPASGGILEFDSNAACVIDGRRREDVVWKLAAPPGHYVVKVDAFSLCGAAAARWRVEVTRAGVSLARAEGIALEGDTESSHDRGDGLIALEVDVP